MSRTAEEETYIRIAGLKGLDEHELRDTVPTDALEFEPEEVEGRPGAAHEPATVVAIVLLTAAGLKGLAAWLLKKRHRDVFEFEAEVKRPDGSFEKRRVHMELSESSTDTEVVRAVGEQLGVDESLITKAVQLEAG